MKTVFDKADSRGFFNHGWLKTYHTFSFADYYNPERMNFGALRVLNDDTVSPGKGFGLHPHKNMEVVSIPLKGYLRHGDNINNESTITSGDVQVMSTGKGMFHSEYNASVDEELKFLQIWIVPKLMNTEPCYFNYNIRPLLKHNELVTFISPEKNTNSVQLLQDAWFSIGRFDTGKAVTYKLKNKNMGAYIFVLDGNVRIQSYNLSKRDGMGIWDTDEFGLHFVSDSEVLVIEVPMI